MHGNGDVDGLAVAVRRCSRQAFLPAQCASHDPSALGRRPGSGDGYRDSGPRDTIDTGTAERIYVKHTGQPLEVISNAVERDKFLSPLEAKAFGLIDDVVVSRPPREDEAKARA